MADNDNRRKLYDNINKEYDLPDYNQFSKDMEDDTKRKSLYNAVAKEYDLPDYDQFSKDMGYGQQSTQQEAQTENAQQNVTQSTQSAQQQTTQQPQNEQPQQAVPVDKRLVEKTYDENKKEYDKQYDETYRKLAKEGRIKMGIENHPNVKMVAVTDDLIKKFPILEQSRGYQVPFDMNYGTPIMQNLNDKGDMITPEDARDQYTKILTGQDFDYVPQQETAAVQVGNVYKNAVSTKGGWLDRAAQGSLEYAYGKDWKDKKYEIDGKEIGADDMYQRMKQELYDDINKGIGNIRQSLLFATDEERKEYVDGLYNNGYLSEKVIPKATVLHYVNNVGRDEQVEELKNRRTKAQVQKEMIEEKLNVMPQQMEGESDKDFYNRSTTEGALYKIDLRKLDKQINQYDAAIDELEGRNTSAREWKHAFKTSGILSWGAWDFGATDLEDAIDIYPLARKVENGRNMSQADYISLKILSQENDADAVEGAVMPSSYNTKKGGLVSAPFTLQFMGGSSITEGVTSAVDKAVVKGVKGMIYKVAGKKALSAAERLAEKAAGNKIVGFLGMLGKDVEKAFIMENTTGAATTGAEILNRRNGTVTETEQGFDWQGETLPTAIIKGEVSQNIELQTEYLGEHFPSSLKFIRGMAHTKVGSAMGLRNLAAWLSKMSRKDFANTIRSYATKGGINGLWGEYMEEVAGTAENALFVGDQKLSDLLDAKQQEETFDTVALSCIGMGIFGSAMYTCKRGLAMPRYYYMKHLQGKWDNTAMDLFSGDTWAKLKDKIDNTPNEKAGNILAGIVRDQSLSEQQARAAFNYARCMLTVRGMNIGAMKAAQLGLTDDQSIEQDQAYVEGRETKDEDKHDVQVQYEDKTKKLAGMLGISELQLSNMSDEELESLTGNDDKLDEVIYDYQNAHAKYQGVVDNANDKVDEAAQKAAQQTDMMTDKSRGTVRSATIKATEGAEDYDVYLVSGNVATNEDGSINVSESDQMILYYDPNTGRIEHADASRFASVGEERNAEEVKNQAVEDAKDKVIRKEAGIIDGAVTEGSSFSITDADGNEHTYEVLADNGDGSAMISVDGNVQNTPVSIEDLQKMKDAEDAKRLEAAKLERQQIEEERKKKAEAENAPVEDNLDYSDIINNDGKIEIADVVDADGNSIFPDAQQVFFIQNQGNRAKVMVLDNEGNLTSKMVKKSAVRSLGTMSVDEYKQERQQTLKSSANETGTSIIEDNRGENEDLQPIGKGSFGNIYNQFKGKVKEAFKFLIDHKDGDLLGVFHRDDVGDIDLVWGNDKMGLAHIIGKHIGKGKDFDNVDDAINMIDEVINKGSLIQDTDNRYVVSLNGFRVGIRKNFDGAKKNWIVTAIDYNRSKEEKGIATNPTSASHGVEGSELAVPNDSQGKDTSKESNAQENAEKITLEDGTVVPMKKDGNPDFSQLTAKQTAELYDTQFGEDAEQIISDNVAKSKKALDKANRMTVKGGSFVEQKASKEAKDKAIAEAQERYDSAKAIADAYNERQLAKEEDTPEGRRNLIEKARRKYNRLKSSVKDNAEALSKLYKETVGTVLHHLYDGTGIDVFDDTPHTVEEYVASRIAPYSLSYEGTETSKGVKQETGLSREDFAKRGFLAKDGKGKTIDQIVHDLWENRPEHMQNVDDQEIRNAVIDYLQNAESAFGKRNYIQDRRIEEAEGALEEQKRQAEQLAYEEQRRAAEAEQHHTDEAGSENEGETGGETSDETGGTGEGENTESETGEDDNSDMPFPAPSEDEAPFSVKDETEEQTPNKPWDEWTPEEKAAYRAKNRITDTKLVDDVIGKKLRKALERIAKMMGAKIQWQRTDVIGNGWFNEDTNTIYITMDSSILEGVQSIFGHEMTHEIKTKSPDMYEELKGVVKDMYGEDLFEGMTDYNEKRYTKAGIAGYDRSYYEEETVADGIGKMLNDNNLAHSLALKMSHPLLAKIHDVLLRVKNALLITGYDQKVRGLIRTIEQVYVSTANHDAVNTAIQEGEGGQRLSLRTKADPKKTQKVYKLMRLNPAEGGKLYPLFIGSGEAIELGKWYDADSPKLQDVQKLSSKEYTGTRTVKKDGKKIKEEYNYGAYLVNNETGEAMSLADFKEKYKSNRSFSRMGNNPNVAAINWATDNGYRWIKIEEKDQGQSRYGGENRSYYNYGINGTGAVGLFAMRPGWHAGSLPTMRQIGKGKGKDLRDDNFVWVEGEIPADIDYNEEAQANVDKDIPDHIPTDGYYLKATNANKEASQADKVGWYVAGAFKANRIMGDKEARDVIDSWNEAHPNEEKVEYDWQRESGKDFDAETMSLEGEPKFSLRVYHGTGADFTEFDFDHMGEGTGDQIFGWGGYVTSSKEIGKSYAYLTGKDVKYIGDNANTEADLVANLFQGGNRTYDDVHKLLQETYDREKSPFRKRVLDWFEQTKPSDWKDQNVGNRNLYEVNIPDDNGSNYLDFYAEAKPELKEAVLKRIKEGITSEIKAIPHYEEYEQNYYDNNGTETSFEDAIVNDAIDEYQHSKTVKDFYHTLELFMTPRLASKYLSSLGYTGIKYPAGTIMGGNKKGDMNYVIFKPEDMQIAEHEKFSLKSKPIDFKVSKSLSERKKQLNEIKILVHSIIANKGGEIKGAFLHPQIGAIDILYGDNNGGLLHIINKHIGKGKSFSDIDSAIEEIDNIINKGKTDFENGDKIVLKIGGKTVTIRKNFREKGKKIADRNWILTAYNELAADDKGAINTIIQGKAALPTANSAVNVDNSSETSKQNGEKFSLRLQNAIDETDTEPTDAQKKSGNYKKGHVKFGGYDYTIENPKGSYRSGVDENGKEWKQKMHDTYGYIRGKFGKDGDHLDMFINDKADLDNWKGTVYVVDQVNEDGSFDEHKVMYGYDSLEAAKKAYLSNYEKGWTGLGNISAVEKADFDKWLDRSDRKLKPFAEYKSITSKSDTYSVPNSFEEFLNHPVVRFSIRNARERAAAEDAYNYAQENRPDRHSQYAIVDMDKPGAMPEYMEKKKAADNWRRYYNRMEWGNYKLFDLNKPFEENVKNLVGRFPNTFRKENDDALTQINKLSAEYSKRKDEYEILSDEILKHIDSLMARGYTSAEATQQIKDWGEYDNLTSKYQELMGIRKQLNDLKSGKAADGERYSLKDSERKQAQLEIINKTNPMLDDYHTGIRKVEDIKTFEESVDEARQEAEKYDYDEWSSYPDITNDMLQNALDTGEITIYSSKKIKNGVFVTPSYMQASDYAGGGRVYEKTVPLTDVAWINTDEGQYAKVDGERYSLIGKKGAANLDHEEEASTRLDNLNVARQMEDAKKDAKAIKMATGWERGADGKWRYEIPDAKLSDMTDIDGKGTMVKRNAEDMLWTSGKLGDKVDAPSLFKAYPGLREVRLETDAITNGLPSSGSFNPETNIITIHASDLKYLNSILNHEIQHAIQHTEGFARGGSPEMFHDPTESDRLFANFDKFVKKIFGNADVDTLYGILDGTTDEYKEFVKVLGDKYSGILKALRATKKYTSKSDFKQLYDRDVKESNKPSAFEQYQSLAGEVESRNVQSRMNMTPEERRNSLVEETEDVARKDQIFLYGDGERYSLRSNKDAEYLDAVKNGDMEKAQKMVDEAAKEAGYVGGTDYQGEGSWNAPSASVEKQDFANLDALREFVEEYSGDTNVFGIINGVTTNDDDFYYNPGRVGFRDAAASESSSVLRKLKYDKADADTKVRVFRAVPTDVKGNKLMSGDWIALSRQYCIDHGNGRYGEGNYRIIEDEVPIKTIWNDGNDMREFGFDDGNNNEAEKNVPNNRKMLDAVTYDDEGNVIPLSERFNEDNDDIRYSLKEVNDRFNEQLSRFTLDKADNFVFDLGKPSEILKSAGVADKPIRLNGSKLAKKIRKHGFESSELKNLPLAIEKPIAVFDNLGRNGNRSILTELKTANGNFLVTVDLGKGTDVDFDVVSSVFGKNGKGVVYWINHDMMKYVDKRKALNYLHLSAPIAEASDKTELSSAANVVRNFENPKQNDENLQNSEKYSLRIDRYRAELNQWKRDNNLPKDAERPQLPIREPNESAADFLHRVKDYRRQAALWATAPTYEDHLLTSDTALGQFNLEMQRKTVLARIAIQDSMLAIRKAQEAIMKEVGADKLNFAEDAYTAENRSHGKAKNEFEEYNDEFLQPLRKAYNALMKRLDNSYDNVKVYMIAKHGLERNAYIAFKKALDEDYKKNEERIKAYNDYMADIDKLNNDADFEAGKIDFDTWKNNDVNIRTKYAPSYSKYRFDEDGNTQDYSGLSALFDTEDFENAAADLVKDVEDNNSYWTNELWYATNDATKKILRDSYNAGMMTEDVFNFVRGMYKNYIPLRGWGDTNADQVWNYVGGGKGAFNQTLKEAEGRKSLADDPIAYIENMAESGILMNNRNWVKQHLLLLAQNHPTSLLSVSKAWYIKTKDAQGNEEWIPASPQITANMDSKQIKAAIDAFEKKMENMQKSGDATQKREHLEISYPQTNSEEREHEVRVMKNGEEYVIYVNGDPQLAQAMNNSRARKVREGLENSLSARVLARTGRYMAAAYTSMSPLFIPSNYMRDLTMTLASTAIREDARYNWLLRKNMLTHWNTFPMVLSYQNGTLREKVRNGSASKVEQMFYDFMMNGGETGFVSAIDVEDLKKKFRNDLKDMNRMAANPKKVGHIIMDSIETLNRAIEDSNRFMVYMTSIEYGRSIEEAVNNAKDVTLNFNRKGTGEHGWQTIRNLYLFINPAIQSLQTLGALAKHHPVKFTAVTTAWMASGVLVPLVNNLLMSFFGGDDDKDKYWQFTKWDRRNNFIMWVPFTHEFIKIPLAQEFRGFYGVGDMIASKLWGGDKAAESWRDYALDMAGQVVDMLPLDPTGYDGNFGLAIMPNVVRPLYELAFNIDFTGKPLFKESDYNKYDPNFTKAYVGTPDWLVRISRMVNSVGNPYPDVQQNWIDRVVPSRFNLNNPAVTDHVLSSYLGGAYTMGSQILGIATKALNGDDIKMADIPLASKFVSNPDDRPASKKQGDEFWTMKDRHDRTANTLSKLKQKAKVDGDYSALDIFFGSKDYKQYKEDDKAVKKYEEQKKMEKADANGEEYKPHKTTAEDVYKSHTTPKDDFEDMKMKQLYEKLNSYKIRYEAIDAISGEHGDAYYKANKDAIDAIEEVAYDRSTISSIKKGFLYDGKDSYDADGMKDIRELRKRILNVLEKANKSVVNKKK